MGKFLVIVESPAKSSTIGGYLGPDYEVKSSLGHVRDLPSKTKFGGGMSVDPDKNWEAEYAISERHKKIVAELRKAASKAEAVYLATDPDREGEAIAWHLSEVLSGNKAARKGEFFKRVVFNEITREAIRNSFVSPGKLDMRLVEAQWSRRFLDRVVGYRLSPLLWKKSLRGASAGRVQSVSLRLLVERERAIRAFVPKEQWEIKAQMEVGGELVEFRLSKLHGKAFQADNREAADKHLAALKQHLAQTQISARDDRPMSPRPGAPFITSSLQRTASSRLSLSIRRTMQLAQSLYEAGLITYMRTDSTHLSEEAVASARRIITERFDGTTVAERKDKYLPNRPRRYASRAGAQESHEAIRPSRMDLEADDLPRSIDGQARRLYDLIYRRFIACQMTAPRLLSSKLRIQVADYELEAQGRITLFDGFLRVWPEGAGQDKPLPTVDSGEPAKLKSIAGIRKYTQPPNRYSEANLVRELEKRGIGRPSTYADIVATLQKRGYARLEKKRFLVERLGEVVCMRLEDSFPELMDYSFTADMERRLDKVAQGKVNWRKLLDDFYRGFSERLERASHPETGMKSVRQVQTEMACAQCGMPMTLRLGGNGLFLGCSGYKKDPAEGEQSCKTTLNLTEVVRRLPEPEAESSEAEPSDAEGRPADHAAPKADSKAASEDAVEILPGRNCPNCSRAAMVFQVDAGQRLWVCGGSPDCEWTQIEKGNFADVAVLDRGAQKLNVHLKELPCVQHPEDYYILKEGRNGLFLSASGWPKRKEARSILVEELPSAADELGEKYGYLLKAPGRDPEGKPTEVCFSKKSQMHFVRTAGLARNERGWAAFYDRRNNSWKALEGKPPATGKGAGKSAGKGAAAGKAPAAGKVAGGKKAGKRPAGGRSKSS